MRSSMQKKIYDYIAACLEGQGYPPSVREIAQAVGLKSPSTVHFHLKHLEEQGYLRRNEGKGRAICLTDRRPEGSVSAAEPRRDRVPILGSVAAGSPILAEECVEDYLCFETGGRDEEFFALRVRGESMRDAGILPGDLVVVHRQPSAEHGEIVVALFEDEATVKRLSLREGAIWLLPENEHYQPIDGRNARILGRVSAVVRQY